MYLFFISGSYRGSYNLNDVIDILTATGFFDTNVPKLNIYNSKERINNELMSWKIGDADYLDLKHKWRVVKIG